MCQLVISFTLKVTLQVCKLGCVKKNSSIFNLKINFNFLDYYYVYIWGGQAIIKENNPAQY